MKRNTRFAIVSAKDRSLEKFRYTCGGNGCGESFIVDASAKFCPSCYTEINAELLEPLTHEKLQAAVDASEPMVKCSSCNETFIIAGAKETMDEVITSLYCPVCGNPEVEEISEESESEPPAELSDDGEGDDDSAIEGEREVQDKIDKGVEDVEAALISHPEPSWSIFKNGKHVMNLVQSKVHPDMHKIFANQLIKVFITRASEVGLVKAGREFNAEFVEDSKVVDSQDLEAMSYDTLRATTMPKFLNCIAIAVEGGAKGVFKDLNNELKAAFFDEIVACGITDEQASKVIEASFASTGASAFRSIIAKAVELLYKPEASLSEIEAIVKSSGAVTSSVTDIESSDIRRRVEAGSISITPSPEPLTSVRSKVSGAKVDNIRQRISLGRK